MRDHLDSGITQAPDTGGPTRHTTWLATVDPDGAPHVVPVGAFWDNGSFYHVGPRHAQVQEPCHRVGNHAYSTSSRSAS